MKINVLGVGLDPVNIETAYRNILAARIEGIKGYITVTGVHGVMESQADESLKIIHNKAYMVVPDGMPMVWISKLKGQKEVDRVYGPDLMLEVFKRSKEDKLRHFFYGGNDGVPEILERRMISRYPWLNVVGTFSPPFRDLKEIEKQEIADMINRAKPDIVWVGLSTPKQERWMAEFQDRLDAPILIGVGAAFDFHAGLKKQAPRFIQRSGFEWLYRTVTEPKRLARRYFHNNPRFVYRIVQQLVGAKKYTMIGLEE